MLARLDVALYIGVYLWPERSQRRFRSEEVVHELLVVPSDVIARLLDAHVLRPHQHGDEVVAFQTAVELHVIGIQVLEERITKQSASDSTTSQGRKVHSRSPNRPYPRR